MIQSIAKFANVEMRVENPKASVIRVEADKFDNVDDLEDSTIPFTNWYICIETYKTFDSESHVDICISKEKPSLITKQRDWKDVMEENVYDELLHFIGKLDDGEIPVYADDRIEGYNKILIPFTDCTAVDSESIVVDESGLLHVVKMLDRKADSVLSDLDIKALSLLISASCDYKADKIVIIGVDLKNLWDKFLSINFTKHYTFNISDSVMVGDDFGDEVYVSDSKGKVYSVQYIDNFTYTQEAGVYPTEYCRGIESFDRGTAEFENCTLIELKEKV